MATISMTSVLSKVKPILFNLCPHARNFHNLPVKEVKIPTQWGFIAGKLWGNDQQRPILAVHGWQDNAGTWDTLIPLLPKEYSFLAIDFPGHGQSSWYPPGMQYTFWDWLRTINIIRNYYKWDKVSLLGHSMGGIASTRFAGLCSDFVDMLIVFENMVPEHMHTFIDNKIEFYVERARENIVKIETTQALLDKEPPSYIYEEVVKRWHLGTNKSVSLESAPYLVSRGTKQSKKEPKKFYFSRDSRLKVLLFAPENNDFSREVVQRIKCPMLYIKATDSKYATDDFNIEIRQVLTKIHDKYEMHFVPGTHHVHLNTPDIVAPILTQFLDKYEVSQKRSEKIQNR